MHHNTNSRKVILITKKCNYSAFTVCVFTQTHTHIHTCGARTVVAHCLLSMSNSMGGQSMDLLKGQSRDRGGSMSLYYDIRGKF